MTNKSKVLPFLSIQSQVHDLQEANESTSVMLAHHRTSPAIKSGLDAASDHLLGHDPSAGSLRREIESLRADLDALRHRNEVVVAENEALRRQEPQLSEFACGTRVMWV